jgi:hypothetical protein
MSAITCGLNWLGPHPNIDIQETWGDRLSRQPILLKNTPFRQGLLS